MRLIEPCAPPRQFRPVRRVQHVAHHIQHQMKVALRLKLVTRDPCQQGLHFGHPLLVCLRGQGLIQTRDMGLRRPRLGPGRQDSPADGAYRSPALPGSGSPGATAPPVFLPETCSSLSETSATRNPVVPGHSSPPTADSHPAVPVGDWYWPTRRISSDGLPDRAQWLACSPDGHA